MMNQVAKTILEQLGGQRFALMTGAKGFYAAERELQFSLPGAGGFCKAGINKVRIHLDASDTYTVEFFRCRRGLEAKLISKASDVYFDMLPAIFREHTGLETRLPRVRGL